MLGNISLCLFHSLPSYSFSWWNRLLPSCHPVSLTCLSLCLSVFVAMFSVLDYCFYLSVIFSPCLSTRLLSIPPSSACCLRLSMSLYLPQLSNYIHVFLITVFFFSEASLALLPFSLFLLFVSVTLSLCEIVSMHPMRLLAIHLLLRKNLIACSE